MMEYVFEEKSEEVVNDALLCLITLIVFAVILSFMGINIYEIIFKFVDMVNGVLSSISNTVSSWISYLHFDKIAEQATQML